jgi:hypothetical protein
MQQMATVRLRLNEVQLAARSRCRTQTENN